MGMRCFSLWSIFLQKPSLSYLLFLKDVSLPKSDSRKPLMKVTDPALIGPFNKSFNSHLLIGFLTTAS